jgi:hypothetical protein
VSVASPAKKRVPATGRDRLRAALAPPTRALAAGLDPGNCGDRYQVVVHVDAAVLADGGESGSPRLADGSHVSAETSRRLVCDSAREVIRHAADGRALDGGRRTRASSPGLHCALEHRDGGCRFPGCGLRLCDAHHVEPWVEGGESGSPSRRACGRPECRPSRRAARGAASRRDRQEHHLLRVVVGRQGAAETLLARYQRRFTPTPGSAIG